VLSGSIDVTREIERSWLEFIISEPPGATRMGEETLTLAIPVIPRTLAESSILGPISSPDEAVKVQDSDSPSWNGPTSIFDKSAALIEFGSEMFGQTERWSQSSPCSLTEIPASRCLSDSMRLDFSKEFDVSDVSRLSPLGVASRIIASSESLAVSRSVISTDANQEMLIPVITASLADSGTGDADPIHSISSDSEALTHAPLARTDSASIFEQSRVMSLAPSIHTDRTVIPDSIYCDEILEKLQRIALWGGVEDENRNIAEAIMFQRILFDLAKKYCSQEYIDYRLGTLITRTPHAVVQPAAKARWPDHVTDSEKCERVLFSIIFAGIFVVCVYHIVLDI
jgi:hypothetical protein